MTTNASTSNILEKLRGDIAQKNRLKKDLERKTLELEENTEEVKNYESSLDQLLQSKSETDLNLNTSKLDEGIARSKQYVGEMSDLVASIITELQDYGSQLEGMQNYIGTIERGLAWVGWTKMADKQRLKRVAANDVAQNLKSFLDYGHTAVEKLYDSTLANAECHANLNVAVNRTADRLQKNEPLYLEWRGKKETAQKELDAVNAELDEAEQDKFGELEKKRATIQQSLDEAKLNETHYFTIVRKAREALPMQRDHVKGYNDAVVALETLRVGLEQEIEHVTEVYSSAKVIIETALQVKGVSQYDKGMKYANKKTTEAVHAAVAGILDETEQRAQRPMLEEEDLRKFRAHSKEIRAKYDSVMEGLQAKLTKNTDSS